MNSDLESTNGLFCVARSRGRAGRMILDLAEANFCAEEISALFLEHITRGDGVFQREPRAEPAVGLYGVMAWLAGADKGRIRSNGAWAAAGPIAEVLTQTTFLFMAERLIEFGVPSTIARPLEERICQGCVAIMVHATASERYACARQILVDSGAEDICSLNGDPRVGSQAEREPRGPTISDSEVGRGPFPDRPPKHGTPLSHLHGTRD